MGKSLAKRKSSLTFAKSDPAISLASLFRPVTRGRRPRGLVLSAPWGENLTLHFKIHTGLDTKDQSLFLTLVALAGVRGTEIDKHSSGVGRQLWLNLNESGDVSYNGPAVVIKTSYYELLKEMDLSMSKASYTSLLESLDRLDGVTFKGETPDAIHPSQKLVTYHVDKVERNITIVLNSRICQALVGHYVRIELGERAQLDTDTAKVLHAWICAWCGAGAVKRIGVDNLVLKVWGVDSTSGSTKRGRRRLLRLALDRINKLPGWSLREDDRNVIHIRRAAVLDAKKYCNNDNA